MMLEYLSLDYDTLPKKEREQQFVNILNNFINKIAGFCDFINKNIHYIKQNNIVKTIVKIV